MKKNTLSIDIELILEDSSTGQLTSNTNVFFGTGRKQRSSQVQLARVQYIPAGDGILTVKADARSSGKNYETTIQFAGVNYVTPGKQHSVALEVPGQEISIMPLRAMRNNVEVRCTCMDFYWRFAMYNSKDDSLLGEPPAPYVKKTKREPNNPSQVPGVCKHLQKLADHLSMQNLLKR